MLPPQAKITNLVYRATLANGMSSYMPFLLLSFKFSIKRHVALYKRMFAIGNVRLYNNYKIRKGGQYYGK